MAALNNKVKAFIVQGLATYMTPSEVVEAVKVEFELDVTRQQVSNYNPELAAGLELSKKYKDLFFKFREDFNANIQAIPIANKAYRLTVLDRMAREAEKSKNRPLTASLIEQAAKEMGDIYVNRHSESDGKGGGENVQPVQVNVNVRDARKPDA